MVDQNYLRDIQAQAAGRVIRGPTDRGVVVLIDDRYRRPQVQRLLPRWWSPGVRQGPSASATVADESLT